MPMTPTNRSQFRALTFGILMTAHDACEETPHPTKLDSICTSILQHGLGIFRFPSHSNSFTLHLALTFLMLSSDARSPWRRRHHHRCRWTRSQWWRHAP
jgi:hypothetical protein